MKQRLLSALAFVSLAVTTMAQAWTEPVAPVAPDYDSGVEWVADGATSYYIKNVGCGQYLTGSNNWATQLSVSANGNPYMRIVIEPAEDDTYPDAVKFKLDGSFSFNSSEGTAADKSNTRDNYSVSDKYLFRDNENWGFVDRNQQACWYWNIIDAGDNIYYIQSAPGMGDLNVDGDQFLEAQKAGDRVKMNGTNETDMAQWKFIPAAEVSLEALEQYEAAKKIYDAKKALYDLYLDAVKYGASTDAAGAVYNSADATAEQLNEAYAELLKLMPAAVAKYATSHGTADAPMEMPYVIANADFSLKSTSGWTIEKPEGATGNYQYQGATYKSEDESAIISGFIESWVPAPNHLGNVKIYQKIGALPEGHYILECDAMAVNQTNPDNDPDNAVDKSDYTGVYLFYNNGTITAHGDALASDFKQIENADGELEYASFPAHFVYEFDHSATNDSIMIGLMADNTNLNWMGADNFVLKYAGPLTSLPSYTALVTEINTSETYNASEPVAQVAVVEAFSTALAEAQALTAGGVDEAKDAQYQAAYTKLNSARLAVAASVEAYKELDSFVEKLNEEEAKYDEMANYDKITAKIGALIEQMEAAQENRNLSAEEIQAAINGYDAMIADAVKEIFADLVAANQPCEPFEITSLFEHMSYAWDGTDKQISFPNGYPAENPVWMNETSTGNFKTNFTTAEVWNQNFKIYRDFADLPKGSYTIETKAFYRVADNATNYPAWINGDYADTDYATLDAGGAAVRITNVAEIASATDKTSNAATITTDEGDELFVPNSQKCANEIFTQEKWAAEAEKCVVQAKGLVPTETGTLRVAITGQNLESNSWVIWHSFRLFYNGEDASAYNGIIEGLIAQAEELMPVVADAQGKIDAAIAAGKTAIQNDDTPAKVAAISALKEAIAYTQEGETLYSKMQTEAQTRQDMIDAIMYPEEGEGLTFTNTEYPAMLDEIMSLDPDLDNMPQSNAQMQTYIDRMANEWDVFMGTWSVEGLESASLDNPVDVSGLIVNKSFDNSWTGWTYTVSRGNPGIEGNSGNCAEFWSTGTFDICQTLPTLKEGYWRLEVDALYRPGNDNNVVNVLKLQSEGNDTIMLDNEFLYAQANGFNVTKKVMPWTDFANGAIKYTLDEDGETMIFAEEDQEAADIIGDATNKYDATAYKFIAPNNRTAMKAFVEAGRYHNVLDFAWTAANGKVKIGLNLLDDITVGSCWCPFDDFRLYYLGTEMPDAVNSVATKAAATKQIFGIDGRQKSNVTRGINIVRMSDGSVQKVLVK